MSIRSLLFPAFVLTALLAATPTWAAVVIQYHHISTDTPPSTSTPPAQFEQHLDYLADQGFEVVPLESLVNALKSGDTLPDRAVAITFDDAYDSVYHTAFPLLKKRGWPFTVFVNTNPLDQGKAGFTSWAQLRTMAEAGATIANHSTAHNHLQRRRDGESQSQWRERIEREVMKAEERIEAETGQNHKMLAYPYGEYNNRVKALLDELGFVAFGQHSGPLAAHSDLLALPRFPFGGPYGGLEGFATKVNTRPMPLKAVELYESWSRDHALEEVVVPAGKRPVLALALSDASMAGRISCFASGQGAIETKVSEGLLMTRANEPLTPGRTRYNCTAGTGEPGRFFWFSQQWLVTGKDGQWLHEN